LSNYSQTTIQSIVGALGYKLHGTDAKMYALSMLFYKYVSDRGDVNASGVDLSFDRVVRDPIESGGLVDSEQLAQAFAAIESSHRLFDGIFDSVNVTSKKLGVTKTERDELLTGVAGHLVAFDTTDGEVKDRLGKVYEVMTKASFYGREINADTYALSIMNAYISGIPLS